MFVKKTLVVSLLAGSGLAIAQGPVGTGSLPGGLGETLPLSVTGQSSLEIEPLTSAATPDGNAGANFSVSEFLSGSVFTDANSRSLPGLGQQTADFVQSQGGGDGGSEPSAPSAPEQPAAPDNPVAMSGGDMDSDSAPGPEDFVSAASNSEPPTQDDLENRASATQTQLMGAEDTVASAESPEAPSDSAAPSAPEGGNDGEAPSQPQQPAFPPEGGGAPEADGFQVAFGVPSDAEEQSPLPQPFALSEIVNVTVTLEAENPSDSGGGAPQAPSAPESGEAPALPVGPEDAPAA
ncbi:MAG: hypothetical protein CMN84_04910 [Spongiibacteraceae bacterium]|nr:hypothetical protein [Spongiibacteraceae bacterium]